MMKVLHFSFILLIKTNLINSIFKIDLGERGWGGLNWIHLAQDRDQWRALVNMVMNLQVP
jgi:hypothetical protein